jgi:hypothetical protein
MATRRYYSAVAVDNTVASGISNSATSVVLSSSPIGFPASYPFTVAIDYDNASEEIVLVTNVTGTTMTITRAYNGSAAVAHNAGATVRHVIVAQDLTDFQDHAGLGLTGGAHGVTGALATFLGTPSSANLASLITDETGTGPVAFSQSPSLATPTISGGSVTGAVISSSKFSIGVNANTGTAYTLVAGDQDKLVTLSNSNPITLTVPAATFSTGAIINLQQIGSGQVTVQGDGTSTVTGTGTKLRSQYSAASVVCTASNTFTLIGDIA